MPAAGTSQTQVGTSVKLLRSRIREWHETATRGVPAKACWGLVESAIETLIWDVMIESLGTGEKELPKREVRTRWPERLR